MTDSLVLIGFVVAYVLAGLVLLALLGGLAQKPRLQPIPIRSRNPQAKNHGTNA